METLVKETAVSGQVFKIISSLNSELKWFWICWIWKLKLMLLCSGDFAWFVEDWTKANQGCPPVNKRGVLLQLSNWKALVAKLKRKSRKSIRLGIDQVMTLCWKGEYLQIKRQLVVSRFIYRTNDQTCEARLNPKKILIWKEY